MQAVVIAFLVAQQQRGGPLLSAAMALLEKRIQIGGEIRWDSQRGHPLVRCWSKKTIELFTKLYPLGFSTRTSTRSLLEQENDRALHEARRRAPAGDWQNTGTHLGRSDSVPYRCGSETTMHWNTAIAVPRTEHGLGVFPCVRIHASTSHFGFPSREG